MFARTKPRTVLDDIRIAARSYATYDQAAYQYRLGFLSERTWRWYRFFWLWTAPRFGGWADLRQQRAYQRLGADAYFRRFDRVRTLRALLAR